MMLIDSHAHLEMPDFRKDLEQVIQRAKESSVGYIFTVGTEKKDWKRALEIADSHPSIYAILGVHPHNAKEIDDQTYPTLRELCRNGKVKAYGEIGLDFLQKPVTTRYSVEEIQGADWISKGVRASHRGTRSRGSSGNAGDIEIGEGGGVRRDHPLFFRGR